MYMKNVMIEKSETGHWHLVGAVYGHDRFPEGRVVRTSRIVNWWNSCGDYEFETKTGSHYFVNEKDFLDEMNLD